MNKKGRKNKNSWGGKRKGAGRAKAGSFHRKAMGYDKRKHGPAKILKPFSFKCPKKKNEPLKKYLPRKVITFIESQLRFTTGRFAAQPFKLFPWQKTFIRKIFGTVDRTGKRIFQKVFLSMGRKNGKTEFVAAIICYLLFTGKHLTILSAASEKGQASFVFDRVAKMVRQNSKLKAACRISDFLKTLTIAEKFVAFKVITSESYSKHGSAPDIVVADELHSWKDIYLFDTLEQSLSAAAEPLLITTTTSGSNKNSQWRTHYDYLKKIISGEVKEPSTYAEIFELDEGDDWKDPANWPKANPSYPVCPTDKYLQGLFNRAKLMKSAEMSFKWQTLNLWTDSASSFVNMELWRGNTQEFDFAELKHRVWWGGLDLAHRIDFCSFVLISPPANDGHPLDEKFLAVSFFFLNEIRIAERTSQGLSVSEWIEEDLFSTPGASTNYDVITEEVGGIASGLRVKGIGFDRWESSEVVRRLEQNFGLKMIEHGQGYQDMSFPIKEFEKLLADGRLVHYPSGCFNWQLGNVVCDQDPAGNIKPNREKSADSIDGFISLSMALGVFLKNENLKTAPRGWGREVKEGKRPLF